MEVQQQEVRNGRKFAALAIDAVVVTVAYAIAAVLVTLLDLPEDPEIWTVLAMLVVVPLAVGALCFRGRTLGTLATGTEFFALSTGRTAGPGRMAWISLVRWWLPVLVVFIVISIFTGGGDSGVSAIHDQRFVRRAR